MSKEDIHPQGGNPTFPWKVNRRELLYVIILALGACLLAWVLTLPSFYPPEYRSAVIIYPTNTERSDMDNTFHEDPQLFLFGDKEGMERLMNIARSQELQLFVIDSLNLWQSYGVEKGSQNSPVYYALASFNYYVQVIPVEGDGLQVEAYDPDPQRAADIVNLLVERIDFSLREVLNQNNQDVLMALKAGEEKLIQTIDRNTDSLQTLRKNYQVFDVKDQTEVLVREVLKEQSQVELELFREGYDKVVQLEGIQEEFMKEWELIQRKITYLEKMLTTPYSTLLVPERAFPTDKKARPVRWLILVSVGLVALVSGLLGVVLLNNLLQDHNG